MNAWNAHSATNANKVRFCKAGLLGLLPVFLLLIPAAQAQVSAPAMSGVKEIVVQYPHFVNAKAAEACGLSQEKLAQALVKTLRENQVPAMPVTEAKPPRIGVARIELVPEIAALDSDGLDCTSWVSLSAQSKNSLRIPPVEVARSVTVLYWRDGAMAASSQSLHQRTVDEILQKLAAQFAQQYRVDQPPELPGPLAPGP